MPSCAFVTLSGSVAKGFLEYLEWARVTPGQLRVESLQIENVVPLGHPDASGASNLDALCAALYRQEGICCVALQLDPRHFGQGQSRRRLWITVRFKPITVCVNSKVDAWMRIQVGCPASMLSAGFGWSMDEALRKNTILAYPIHAPAS